MFRGIIIFMKCSSKNLIVIFMISEIGKLTLMIKVEMFSDSSQKNKLHQERAFLLYTLGRLSEYVVVVLLTYCIHRPKGHG